MRPDDLMHEICEVGATAILLLLIGCLGMKMIVWSGHRMRKNPPAGWRRFLIASCGLLGGLYVLAALDMTITVLRAFN